MDGDTQKAVASPLIRAPSDGAEPIVPSADVKRLNADQVLLVWKTIVDVQQHFNDIGMKIRNLYFTVIAASMGLFGVLQDRSWAMDALNTKASLPMVVVFALIPVSLLFYFLDRHWYHRLLKGAVDQGVALEIAYGEVIPEIRLGAQIARTSPLAINNPILRFYFRMIVSDHRFKDKNVLHSDGKIEVLYKSVIFVALIIFIIYAAFGGVRIEGLTLPFYICHLVSGNLLQPQ